MLLVGDTDYIPTFNWQTSNGPATDLPYSLKDDADYLPDIFVGRFPVASTSQTEVMVEKTIEYEKAHWGSGTAWIKKAAFIAGVCWGVPLPSDFCEQTHNYVISTWLDPNGYTSDKLYAYTYGITNADICNALNNGRSIATYAGHGSRTFWHFDQDKYFTQGDVLALINVDMYPFVFSFACLTGDFAYPECFGETWVRADGRGSVSYWGASDITNWEEDDFLEKELFQAIFDDDLFQLADMTNKAKLDFYQNYGDERRKEKYFHIYNILGDPALELWTDIPSSFNNVAITITSTSVTVNAGVPDVIITTCSDDFSTFHESRESVTGTETFTTSVRPLYITVTKHNYVPYRAVAGGSESAVATAFNNSRKLLRDSSGKYHLVYESDGEIFYQYSTDNGASWQLRRLSAGSGNNHYPSITGTSAKQFVVWQRYKGNNQYDICFTRNTGSGWSTATLIPGLSNLTSTTDPLPVVSYKTRMGGYRLLVCAKSSSGIYYLYSDNDGTSWSSLATLPSTTSSHKNPSLSMGPTTPTNPVHVTYDDGSSVYFNTYQMGWGARTMFPAAPVSVKTGMPRWREVALVADMWPGGQGAMLSRLGVSPTAKDMLTAVGALDIRSFIRV